MLRLARTARALTVLLSLAAVACGAPVTWRDPVPMGGEVRLASATIDAGAPVLTRGPAVLALDPADRPALLPAPTLPFTLPTDACSGSARFARMQGSEWYVAWWRRGAAGAAILMGQRSTDGGATWSPPVAADARDQGTYGCERPAPEISADSASGYVHIAYFLQPKDGAGVWYVHAMDHGAMWHAPVAVIFGDAPSRASVASEGDTVVIAYERPSAHASEVGLATSYTGGHIIAARTPVSGDGPASDPHVALRGRTVAVEWTARAPTDSARTALARVVRLGTLNPPTPR